MNQQNLNAEGAARQSRNQRSADSLVRKPRPAREQHADKAVRAPGKASQNTTMLGDSSAENAEKRRVVFNFLCEPLRSLRSLRFKKAAAIF